MARRGSRADALFLSTLPANISFKELVATAKMRWRIEHDYLELSRKSGLVITKGAIGVAFIIM